MDRRDLSQRYWKYYLLLEERFLDSVEYVEIDVENYNTFSNGYALLIQAIGAELDTIFKVFCGFDTAERKNISDYAQIILASNIEIKDITVSLQEYNIDLQPFEGWDEDRAAQSLPWWTAFTNIKHNRYSNLHQANMENVLNVLSALYLMEMIFLKKVTENTGEIDVFAESSRLFTLKEWSSRAIPMDQAFMVLGDIIENEGVLPDTKYDV